MAPRRSVAHWLMVTVLSACLWGGPVLAQMTEQAWAQSCDAGKPASTPASRFKLNDNGTATDTKTGLTWMRCALGQTWEGGHCSIAYLTYTATNAEIAAESLNTGGGFAGFRDWRLPNVDELAGIIETQCYDPAMNITVFPEAPITGYWSTTPDPDYDQGAMMVHFFYGAKYMSNRATEWAVRLVRDGR